MELHLTKYSNRKLYSKTQSRYVTLTEVANAIRAGAELKVTDNETEHDVTQDTLVSIVANVVNLDKSSLVGIIRGSGNA